MNKIIDYQRHGTRNLRPWSRKIPPLLTPPENLFKDNTCACGKYDYSKTVSNKGEHLKDFENWKRDNYYDIVKPEAILTKSFLPVEFVSSGYKVEPDESVSLKIRIDAEDDIKIFCTFSTRYGDIIPSDSYSAPIQSRTMEMTVAGFNGAMLRYIPNTYDARKLEDLVQLKVTGSELDFEISFPVTIERMKMPVMNHRPTLDIAKRVTIVTKTFLRLPSIPNI